MKVFLLFILLITFGASCVDKHAPVAVIFDTDIAPGYDDVGALAVLRAFADRGEAKILATVSCNAFETVDTVQIMLVVLNSKCSGVRCIIYLPNASPIRNVIL